MSVTNGLPRARVVSTGRFNPPRVVTNAELEKTVVLVENGRYLGFAYVDETFSARNINDFKEVITRYNDNKDVQQIIRQYLRTKHKDKVKLFKPTT